MSGGFLPAPLRSLSARLLVLTIAFVMLSEVLIFLPSVARYRMSWLEAKIASGHLAILALEATPDNMVTQDLANELLRHVGARGVVLRKSNNATLMIDEDMPPEVDAVFDLRDTMAMTAIREAVAALIHRERRVIRVLGVSPREPNATVEVLLDERPLHADVADYAIRIFQLSLVISLVTAALVYLSLQWLLVRPMRGLVDAMTQFRADPEDGSRVVQPSGRGDEIGVAERELAELQETVRQALAQRAHLAALGTAVTKVNHDLRNMLATARLLSDRLSESAPELPRLLPGLVSAIDRAVALCSRTLDFTREGAPPLHLTHFHLAELVAELATGLGLPQPDGTVLEATIPPGLAIDADRDQIYRALFNIARNAVESGARTVTIVAADSADGIVVDLGDDGPGLSPKARTNLFRPFAGSARPGGTGLGLAIAREILRAHGGDVLLVESTATGTLFRLRLPPPRRRARSAAA